MCKSQLLRSRFTRDKNLSARNLTTNFLVNVPIYLEKSKKKRPESLANELVRVIRVAKLMDRING